MAGPGHRPPARPPPRRRSRSCGRRRTATTASSGSGPSMICLTTAALPSPVTRNRIVPRARRSPGRVNVMRSGGGLGESRIAARRAVVDVEQRVVGEQRGGVPVGPDALEGDVEHAVAPFAPVATRSRALGALLGLRRGARSRPRRRARARRGPSRCSTPGRRRARCARRPSTARRPSSRRPGPRRAARRSASACCPRRARGAPRRAPPWPPPISLGEQLGRRARRRLRRRGRRAGRSRGPRLLRVPPEPLAHRRHDLVPKSASPRERSA